jgi:NADH:ubiquinone oxidoreductase subunit 6 (subunit J)
MRKLYTSLPGALSLLVARVAFAQSYGGLSQFTSLASSVLTFVQAIALLGAVLGFIRAGAMYYQGDDRASSALKNAAIGTAVIAGATIIMQFIKSGLLGTSV